MEHAAWGNLQAQIGDPAAPNLMVVAREKLKYPTAPNLMVVAREK